MDKTKVSITFDISLLCVFDILFVAGIFVNATPQPTFPNGYVIVKAHSDSPIITINKDSVSALIAQAQTLNTTTIYDTNKGYMVIDFATSIGYVYQVLPTWFGLPFEFIFVIPVLVIVLGIIFYFVFTRENGY